jgi:hypothetical protein
MQSQNNFFVVKSLRIQTSNDNKLAYSRQASQGQVV